MTEYFFKGLPLWHRFYNWEKDQTLYPDLGQVLLRRVYRLIPISPLLPRPSLLRVPVIWDTHYFCVPFLMFWLSNRVCVHVCMFVSVKFVFFILKCWQFVVYKMVSLKLTELMMMCVFYPLSLAVCLSLAGFFF